MILFQRLLFSVLACLLVVSCEKTEKKRRTVGYKGEARANAFLAAQRLLEGQGDDVVSQRSLGDLDYDTSTIFLSPSSLNTVSRTKRLLTWVEDGGHLVVMLSSGEKRGNDFHMRDKASWSYLEDGTPGLNHILEQLNIELIDWEHDQDVASPTNLERDDWEAMDEIDRALLGSEEVEYALGGKSFKIHHWADKGLEHEIQYEEEYGSGDITGDDKHRFLSLFYGVGRVTLLTDASPLRNRYIAYADHARLLTEIVDLSRDGQIVFSDGGEDNFFSMVWRFFSMAVIGMAVLIFFWLWKNLPRFGPPQDLPDGGSREFSGQVQGIGRFLWRHKRDDAMLGSLRRTVNRRLSLGAEGLHEGVFDQLSERTGLPVETIIEAMTREQVREPGVMVRIVKNLQHILKHIN